MAKSFQHRRNRQRPSRVNISYDVEIGGAMEKKEIPFVMGVMSDLSGDGMEGLPEVTDRKFTEISADTFDKVLKGMNPRLKFAVWDQRVREFAGEQSLNRCWHVGTL